LQAPRDGCRNYLDLRLAFNRESGEDSFIACRPEEKMQETL